jgi:hypothetical protein
MAYPSYPSPEDRCDDPFFRLGIYIRLEIRKAINGDEARLYEIRADHE